MSKYSRFFSLFNSARTNGLLPYRDHHVLVEDLTDGRYKGLGELPLDELRRIEAEIERLMQPQQDSANRMRRKIIGILKARGAVLPGGKADMPHVYAWVLKYGYLHKDLNAYTVAELTRLVSQAEAITVSDIKAIAHHG